MTTRIDYLAAHQGHAGKPSMKMVSSGSYRAWAVLSLVSAGAGEMKKRCSFSAIDQVDEARKLGPLT